MPDDMIRFRPDDRVTDWLYRSTKLARTGVSPSMQAKADLALLQVICDAELRRVRLTLAQAKCIADVLNGAITDATIGVGLGLAYAECYDAFQLAREGVPEPDASPYGAKWGPKESDPAKFEQDLLEVLGRLGPAADYALRRAVASWWDNQAPASAEGFASVGIRITGS